MYINMRSFSRKYGLSEKWIKETCIKANILTGNYLPNPDFKGIEYLYKITNHYSDDEIYYVWNENRLRLELNKHLKKTRGKEKDKKYGETLLIVKPSRDKLSRIFKNRFDAASKISEHFINIFITLKLTSIGKIADSSSLSLSSNINFKDLITLLRSHLYLGLSKSHTQHPLDLSIRIFNKADIINVQKNSLNNFVVGINSYKLITKSNISTYKSIFNHQVEIIESLIINHVNEYNTPKQTTAKLNRELKYACAAFSYLIKQRIGSDLSHLREYSNHWDISKEVSDKVHKRMAYFDPSI